LALSVAAAAVEIFVFRIQVAQVVAEVVSLAAVTEQG
jgi:hypothetical protein